MRFIVYLKLIIGLLLQGPDASLKAIIVDAL
ncbi:hypothetical protein HALO59_150127 [Halomonas sp. 59]|nr:hypothetical protein HALO59_150127 [Halomonas sp. 59]CAD5257770.1 hypothetical protein HALO113_160128 [Halomonas sp. 113]